MSKKRKGRDRLETPQTRSDGDRTVRLGGDEGRYLVVQIEGQQREYRVPLADSLKMADAMALRKVMAAPSKRRDGLFFEWFYGFFCRYVPEKVTGQLSMDDFGTLAQAWNEASEEGGAQPGE